MLVGRQSRSAAAAAGPWCLAGWYICGKSICKEQAHAKPWGGCIETQAALGGLQAALTGRRVLPGWTCVSEETLTLAKSLGLGRGPLQISIKKQGHTQNSPALLYTACGWQCRKTCKCSTCRSQPQQQPLLTPVAAHALLSTARWGSSRAKGAASDLAAAPHLNMMRAPPNAHSGKGSPARCAERWAWTGAKLSVPGFIAAPRHNLLPIPQPDGWWQPSWARWHLTCAGVHPPLRSIVV